VLLEKKRLLITGVLTPQSIAFAAAESCLELGAEIVLTNFGRGVSLTEKVAKRLPDPPDVLEMDANDPAQVARLEVIASTVVQDAYTDVFAVWPAELESERDVVADAYFGAFQRRSADAATALAGAGATARAATARWAPGSSAWGAP